MIKKVIFRSLTIFTIILFCSFNILANETSFVYSEPLDPYNIPMLLDASTIIDFDNSNMCSEWDKLTEEQQTAILSNVGLNDFNISFVTDNNLVYLGKAIWCSSYENGVYRLHGESNVSNTGLYLVNENGTLTRSSEYGNFSIKSIFYTQYRVGSIWFNDYNVSNNNCEIPITPNVPPSLNLPNVNIPNISVDNEQNTFINTYGSNAIKGGRVTGLVIDYYNIYSVVQTSETDEFFNSRNDNYYVYQQSNGNYIFAVYDHSELQVFAPNMNVSNQRINLVDYAIGDFSYVYVSSNNAIIQRDVSTFNIKYIDELQKRLNDYDKLPFSNSSDNKNHLEYLGVKSESEYFNTSSSSIEIPVPQEGTSGLLFYFVVTDNYSSIQNATTIDNQTIINSNMNENFTQLDNQLKDMASTNDNGQFEYIGNELIDIVETNYTGLFYPVTWSIDLFNDMANVEPTSIIEIPALFKTNETFEINFGIVEQEIPELFTFIRSIVWVALALLCINGLQNIVGGSNDN